MVITMGFYGDFFQFTRIYPLANKHDYGESPFVMGRLTISMAIFNIYVIDYRRVPIKDSGLGFSIAICMFARGYLAIL